MGVTRKSPWCPVCQSGPRPHKTPTGKKMPSLASAKPVPIVRCCTLSIFLGAGGWKAKEVKLRLLPPFSQTHTHTHTMGPLEQSGDPELSIFSLCTHHLRAHDVLGAGRVAVAKTDPWVSPPSGRLAPHATFPRPQAPFRLHIS